MSEPPRKSTQSRTASNADSRLSIADLRASGVTFEWYEAVAIVQDLCRAINESRDPVTETELALNQVFIDPEGTISIGARPDPEGALPHVRKLLIEMLPSSEVARVKDLPDSSLEEFSRALEYHERPNRAEVIHDARGRWRPLPVRALDQIVEPEKTPEAKSETNGYARLPRAPRLVAAAVVAVAVVGVAVWALRTPELEAKIGTHAAAVSSGKAPTAATDSPSSTSGKPSGKPTPTRPERTPTAHARPPRSEISAQPRADVQAAGAADRFAIPGELVVSAFTSSAPAALNQPGPPTVPTTSKAEPADSAVSTQVFDATQRDVVPPAFLNPRVMTPLPPGASQNDAVAIEVMVNERGTIDAIKACRSPRTLGESLQMTNELSVAKNWRFGPATRDGHPVKYRLVVPMTVR